MNAETFSMPVEIEHHRRLSHRIKALSGYGVHLDPRSVAALPQPEFDALLKRTRESWESVKAREIVQSWAPRTPTIEEIALSNKWGPKL